MDYLRGVLSWLSGNSRHLNDAQKAEIHQLLVVLRREMENEIQSSSRHQTHQFSDVMRNTRTMNEKKHTDLHDKVQLQGAVLKAEMNQVTQLVDEKTDSLDRKIDTVTREYDEQLKILKGKVKELENVKQPQEEKKKEEKTEKDDEINKLAESLKELMMTLGSRNQVPPNVPNYPQPDQYGRYPMPAPGPNSGYFPPPAHFHPTQNPYPWPHPPMQPPHPSMQYPNQPMQPSRPTHPPQRPVHPSYNSSAVQSPPPLYDGPGPSSLPNYHCGHHENVNTTQSYADSRANNNKPFGENDSGQRGGRGKSLPNYRRGHHEGVNTPHSYADSRANNNKPFGENDSGQRGKPFSGRGNRGRPFIRGNQGRGGGDFHPRNNHFDGKKFHKYEKQSFSENDARNSKPVKSNFTRCDSLNENPDSDACSKTKDTNKNQQNHHRNRPKTSDKFQFNSHDSCDGNDSDTSTTSQMSSVSSCSKFSNKKKQFNRQYKYTGNNRKPYLSSDSESVKSGVFTNKNSKASSNVNSESSDLKKVQYIPKAEALQKNKDLHKPFATPVTCLGKANGLPVNRVANCLAEIYAFEECYGTCQLIQY